jgi:transcriptional regulator with XRE-family HTH domain
MMVSGADVRAAVREFLTTHRNRLSPGDAGVPAGKRRRVAGLRREEVAELAGVSVDYYVRLERGNLTGVSEGVLSAVARALQLTDTEQAHLFDLARTANSGSRRRDRPATPAVRPELRALLDSMSGPAWIRNGRLDLLEGNQLGRALYAPMIARAVTVPNKARFVFLDPTAATFYPDWDGVCRNLAAVLRAEAGRHPYDDALSALIGDLSTRSTMFRAVWAEHDVLEHQRGSTHFHHPVVGELELGYEALQVTADAGLVLVAYRAEPGSVYEERLRLLASWAATEEIEAPLGARPRVSNPEAF